MSDKKLKPCPFCGGEATAVQKFSGAWVRCLECSASIYEDGRNSDSQKLIEIWNKRVSSGEED